MPKVTGHRHNYPLCPLTFSQIGYKHQHIQQQHSKNPQRFPCTICGNVLTRKHNLKIHLATVHAEQKPCYRCEYCNARFTRKSNRQRHQRNINGRICREQDVNLQIHPQHLSESDNFQDEWMFVESRPIEHSDYDICPCGQPGIKSYFFLENKYNGIHTFVGSSCIRNLDPRASTVIRYFKHIMENSVQAKYKGQDSRGLQ